MRRGPLERFVRATWTAKRHDIAVEVTLGVVFSVVVGLAILTWQNQVDDRREDRAAMLTDLTYIRETLRDGGERNFRNMNLRGANLSGLDLSCPLELTAQGTDLAGAGTAKRPARTSVARTSPARTSRTRTWTGPA